MLLSDRRSGSAATETTIAPPLRSRMDVVFIVCMGALLAVHAVIFFATLFIAPVTAAEQQSLDLLHLPVEVARALTLPFVVLLIASLFVLGRRAAGRWAGWAAIFAVFSLDLRSDFPLDVVYGPSVATGGLVAGALLAAAMVVLPKHRLAAAALLGTSAAVHGLSVLTLPAFLIVLSAFPLPHGASGAKARAVDLLRFTGVWAVPFVVLQAIWLLAGGAAAYGEQVNELLAEFRPHALIGVLEQQKLTFQSWHFPFVLTICFAAFLFSTGALGVIRYGFEPRPLETGPRALVLVRRFPMEFWAGGLTLVLFSTWWSFSGGIVVIEPNLPVLLAVVPLITAMAYRGAKWLIPLGGFWRLFAIGYLAGLVLARSAQMVLTMIEAFQR